MSPKHCSSSETLPSSQQSTDYIQWMLPLQEYKPFSAPCLLFTTSGAVPRTGHGIWGVRKGITPDNSSDLSRRPNIYFLLRLCVGCNFSAHIFLILVNGIATVCEIPLFKAEEKNNWKSRRGLLELLLRTVHPTHLSLAKTSHMTKLVVQWVNILSLSPPQDSHISHKAADMERTGHSNKIYHTIPSP